MKTEARISFGVYDITGKEDSSLSASNSQEFARLDVLKEEAGASPPLVGTLEEDYFLLDGSFAEFPDDPSAYDWGFFSDEMSDENGQLSTVPTLVVDYSYPHGSAGLTLAFDTVTGDYPKTLNIAWYDPVGGLILQKNYHPASNLFVVDEKVENYQKIEIHFLETSKPFRYAKMNNIRYGIEKVFSGEDIMTASVLEEIDPTSSEVRINTMQCKIFSLDDEFSILNPQGIFSVLQERQPLVVEEIVGGNTIPMGTFYLDEWNNAEESTVEFSAIDLIGIIDKTNFVGGMFKDVLAGDLIDQIMGSAGVAYRVDDSLREIPVSGYLPICTHREALQQVAFAIGAIVYTCREDAVIVAPMPVRPSSYISRSRKFSGGSVKLRSLVTGVDVAAKDYLPETNSTEVFSQTLQPGTYTIVFDKPLYSVDVTGASVVEFNTNIVIVDVVVEGEVKVNGVGYKETSQAVSVRTQNLAPNVTPNVLQTQGATLISAGNAKHVANSLYNYYQKRYENEFEMISNGESIGDTVIVDSLRGERLKGTIESMETDLAGGFISRVKVVGVRVPTATSYFAGELYAGEKFGVI